MKSVNLFCTLVLAFASSTALADSNCYLARGNEQVKVEASPRSNGLETAEAWGYSAAVVRLGTHVVLNLTSRENRMMFSDEPKPLVKGKRRALYIDNGDTTISMVCL